MHIHHLRHFLTIAETGSLTRAADRLGIAQPALSQSIKKMESELGVRLFQRSQRGTALTIAGQAILEDVRMSVSRIDAAEAHARQIGQGLAGTLRIAFVAAASFEMLPSALRAHRARSPNVRYVLREMSNMEQVAALEKGEIDLAVLYTPEAVNGRIRQRLLTRHRLVAAVHEDVPVGDDGKVSLRDLAREGLVFFGQDQVPHLRGEILSAMQKMGEEARVVQEANRTLTVLGCVAAKFGISLLSTLTRAIDYPGVRFCEIRERQSLPMLEISAMWPARSRPTLADEFVQLLADAI
jgi:DNA-binding transcriptional LysR family regulator